MSKVLYLDEARQHTLSAGPKHLLRLLPGRNVVEDELFDAVLNTLGKKEKPPTQLQKMIDDKTVVVHGESLDIAKMKADDAIGVIELETTIEGLQDLLTQEETKKKPRKSVVDAIQAKVESIEEAADKKTDEDNTGED